MKKKYLGRSIDGCEFYRMEPDTLKEHIEYFFACGGLLKIVLVLLVIFEIIYIATL